jgi:hypothetical protein
MNQAGNPAAAPAKVARLIKERREMKKLLVLMVRALWHANSWRVDSDIQRIQTNKCGKIRIELEGSRSGESREVPMIPGMRELLERMKSERPLRRLPVGVRWLSFIQLVHPRLI